MQDLGAGDAGAVNSVAEERVGDSVGLQRLRWDWVLGARLGGLGLCHMRWEP